MKKLPKLSLGQKPTYRKIAEDLDFYALFQKIEQQFENCFLFESLGEEGKFARYSIIGFDPKHLISARQKTLVIDGESFVVENPYQSLQEIMPTQTVAREYAGGLVGYLNYDAVNYFGPSISVKIHNNFEQFLFGFYADGLVFDKLTNELFYFFYDNNREALVNNILTSKLKKPKELHVSFLGDSLTKEEFIQDVEKVKEHILAGNTFQCEVGFKSKYRITGDTIHIYDKLRKVNPSPFMYYLKFGDPSINSGQVKKIIGASPELLFSLRDGEMTTRPLAGTIARGNTSQEDKKLARILLTDPKERAEHTMLVDLHRNDIGRVAQFGTVKVRDLMTIEKYRYVQHIASEVTGIIRSDETMFSALAANFPTGTLTGAPKIESIKIIDSNEKEARGPYGGGVGHFGFNGDCTFAIAIRSLFISGENAFVQTSAGVVYDSIPEQEYNEVEKKLTAMRKVLEI